MGAKFLDLGCKDLRIKTLRVGFEIWGLSASQIETLEKAPLAVTRAQGRLLVRAFGWKCIEAQTANWNFLRQGGRCYSASSPGGVWGFHCGVSGHRSLGNPLGLRVLRWVGPRVQLLHLSLTPLGYQNRPRIVPGI